jgi:hypothetical protein
MEVLPLRVVDTGDIEGGDDTPLALVVVGDIDFLGV